MSLKSYLCTLTIFCGGYVINTLLDSAVEAAEAYFQLHTSTYKTDSRGYIICSREKPNDNLRSLTLNAWRIEPREPLIATTGSCFNGCTDS